MCPVGCRLHVILYGGHIWPPGRRSATTAPFMRGGMEDGFWLPLPTTVQPSPLSFRPWRCPCGDLCLLDSGWTGPEILANPIREVGWRKESKATHLVPCSLSAGSSQTCGPCTKGHSSVGRASPAKVLTALCYVPCTLPPSLQMMLVVKFSPHYPDSGRDRSSLCARILSKIEDLPKVLGGHQGTTPAPPASRVPGLGSSRSQWTLPLCPVWGL